MKSGKLNIFFNKISKVVHYNPPRKNTTKQSSIRRSPNKTINKNMDIDKQISMDEIRRRLKTSGIKQNEFKDIINFRQIQYNPNLLIELNNKQREIFFQNTSKLQDALYDHISNIEKEIKQTKEKEQIKKLTKEKKQTIWFSNRLQHELADLEKNVKNLFKIDDINSKESPSYQSHPTKEFGKDKIPNHITELLYNIRQSPIEFGGGYSPELFYNDYKLPETIVLRKFKPTSALHDREADLPIHTHPKRFLNFKYWNDEFEKLDDRIDKLMKKTKKEKTKKRLIQAKYDIASPYDYLPSKADVMIAKTNGKSNLLVSEKGMFVMTSPPDMISQIKDLNFDFDKELDNIMKYAMLKSKLHKRFHSISQLENRIKKYNGIVTEVYRKALERNDIRSEFYPKEDYTDPKFIQTEDKSVRFKNRKIDRDYNIRDLKEYKQYTGTKKRFR